MVFRKHLTFFQLREVSQKTTIGGTTPNSKGSSDLRLSEEAEFKASLNKVRSGQLSWVLLGYAPNDFSVLITLGEGSDTSVDALKQLLRDDMCAYGLVRKGKLNQTDFKLILF
jgi:hypothetical protein